MKDRFLHEPLSNIYRLQTKFGARQCFYMHVSFCSRGEGENGGVFMYEGGLCQGRGFSVKGRGLSVRGGLSGGGGLCERVRGGGLCERVGGVCVNGVREIC